MVKYHGNWCGPNWTDGKNISAREYRLRGGDFLGACVDALDCACRTHDKDCKSGVSEHIAEADFIAQALKIKRNSVFCLEPPGYSAVRRSMIDSILSGCIPVLFMTSYARLQIIGCRSQIADEYYGEIANGYQLLATSCYHYQHD